MILLDMRMFDMDGCDVLTALKADPEIASIPGVMLTVVDDKAKAFELGTSDYLLKPIDPQLLLASIRKHTRCIQNDRQIEKATHQSSSDWVREGHE
jgi:DNA-binding response OmpR family regulator